MSQDGLLNGAPVELLARERDKVRVEIQSRAWNDRLQSYVSVLDGDKVDAALLLMPWYGFEKADSERMQRTCERILVELGAGNALLYRYKRQPPEGAFGICSFWAVEYLALGGGSLDQARRQFEDALRYQNDLGLFSEEISPDSGDDLGNFPQAFTHVGVISAALTIQQQANRKVAFPGAA
jgi:GH15 family glucan-1,4-alpha-glucosidase